ncbi:MAG: hypothetical protein WAW82_13800 [Candidatus Lutibacillus vidarii]|nr:hypothetical protein [Candidatus Lutibacillus vidarii]HON74363.1 hypothetical protein [Dermatophilaceae bacterium]
MLIGELSGDEIICGGTPSLSPSVGAPSKIYLTVKEATAFDKSVAV